jgi:RNA polymerase sigma-70 factor, ECF subfamily
LENYGNRTVEVVFESPYSTAALPDDACLLRTIAGGDSGAVQALYDLHGSRCFALALRMLSQDHGAAEDVVQEVFMRVWRSAGSYDAERASVQSWLLRITRNACIDLMRGRASRPAIAGDSTMSELPASDDVWRDVAHRLTGETIRAALDTLPAEQKEAINLAYFEGLTCQEIAQRTGIPLGTVKGRLRLGLHKLRSVLGAEATRLYA